MNKIPLLGNTGLTGRLLTLVGIVCISILIVSVPTAVISLQTAEAGKSITESVGLMKLLQFFQSIAIFLIPAIVMAKLVSSNPARYLSLTTKPSFKQIGYTILGMLFITPVMGLIIEWNEGITFPSFLAPIETWMREKEDLAKGMTELMFQTRSWSDWIINLMLAAVTAALCEEFFFRGMLQHLFHDKWRKNLPAILLSAFIFSAIHLQFYGFVPRFLLGAYFGLLLIWSGSLWLPVLAHFLNNALALIQMSLLENGVIRQGELLTGNLTLDYVLTAFTTILFLIFTWKIKKSGT
ncbi:MAG: CPBP family glutamic-type intramembrane protease [Bacteroidales bacterium]